VFRVWYRLDDGQRMLGQFDSDERRGLQRRFADRLLQLRHQQAQFVQTVTHHHLVFGDDSPGHFWIAGADHFGDSGQRNVEVAEPLDHLASANCDTQYDR
jgi:hypothetical protein